MPEVNQLERINILGVGVNSLLVSELHQHLLDAVQQKLHIQVLHANVYGLNLAYQHRWLRQYLNKADIVFCDGAGVILGARLLQKYIPTRITYADWMWQLAEFGEEHELRFFFLGAKPGIIEQAKVHLLSRHPNLKISGYHHGYFDKAADHPDNTAVIQKINDAKPHILLVAFGMPLQEQWLRQNWSQIDANVALTGGAVFDYISGNLTRAPQWMTDNGLEWLGRLLIEPRRLWQRYIIGNPLFLWRVLKQKWGLLSFPNE